MEYTLEDYGRCLTQQKITPGDTATAIGSEIITYTERTLAFTSGGTSAIVAGDWIVGATSGAVAKVVSVSAITGTWAGGDAAGTLTICSQSGTFADAGGQALSVGGTADAATIGAADSVLRNEDYPMKGMMARSVFLQVMTNAALVCIDGSNPNQTLLSGLSIGSYGTLSLTNLQNIKNFKVIDRVSSSASTVIILGYF
jgi:hypothetical protein